jgi:hypothetical protein
MIMQEAKYVEDVIRQIKDDLGSRGLINEHDRLGHFEAKVPLDTLLALAKPNSKVKIFGLQFKRPQGSRGKTYWTLTHPIHQFQQLSESWGNLIFYALPFYFSPTDSLHALEKTYFVKATGMASKHLSFISGKSNLPLKFLENLRGSVIFHPDTFSKNLHSVIAKHGLDAVLNAINDYFKAKENNDLLDEAQHDLIDMGFSPDFFNYTKRISDVVEYLGAYDMTLNKLKITDWSKYPNNLELTLSVRLIAQPAVAGTLVCQSNLIFRKLKFVFKTVEPTPGASWLKYVDHESLPWPRSDWKTFIDGIENCQTGVVLDDNVKDSLNKHFSILFPRDVEGLLIWCDFVEKIYYAIETWRILTGDQESLSNVTDPLSADIPPELLSWVEKEARRRGVRMTDIVKEALEKMQKDRGN